MLKSIKEHGLVRENQKKDNPLRSGFTKAYRKEILSDIWRMPPLYQRVFFYLRQTACWEQDFFPTRKGFKIALNPGQVITSLSNIAKGVSWTEFGVKKVPNKKTIKDILTWLEGNAMVTAFSNRHGTFIIITNWDTYNPPIYKEVTPNKHEEVTPKKRSLDTLKETKELKNLKDNPPNPPGRTTTTKKIKEIKELKNKIKLSPNIQTSFDIFYKQYPKKKSKGQAEKTWINLNPSKELLPKILIALNIAKKSKQWVNDKGKYIPNPSTWLNAKGWEDEYQPTELYKKTIIRSYPVDESMDFEEKRKF